MLQIRNLFRYKSEMAVFAKIQCKFGRYHICRVANFIFGTCLQICVKSNCCQMYQIHFFRPVCVWSSDNDDDESCVFWTFMREKISQYIINSYSSFIANQEKSVSEPQTGIEPATFWSPVKHLGYMLLMRQTSTRRSLLSAIWVLVAQLFVSLTGDHKVVGLIHFPPEPSQQHFPEFPASLEQ